MAQSYFQFKQFTVHQDACAMKVTTDACLFGAWAAARLSTLSGEKKVLDLGTGTGLLALMLAQKNPDIRIEALEIEPSAALQAGENCKQSPWSNRIRVIREDVKLFQPDSPYDGIISNPPFYEKELKGSNLQKNLAHHDEGLLLPDLLQWIRQHLHPSGRFFLLLPAKRIQTLLPLFAQNQLQPIRMVEVKPSVLHPVFRIFIEGKIADNNAQDLLISDIAIKNEKDKYTDAFVELLREYYLYL